jgi:nitrate/nitrite transport system permease protein
MIATAAGLGQIPVDQRNVARVFRFGRVAYLRHVVIPNALPSIMTGLRLSMGVSWMVIVAVERLAATPRASAGSCGSPTTPAISST